MPDLAFSVVGADAVPFSAVPALALKLRIDNRDRHPIRTLSLTAQVRIAATQRSYASAEQEGLLDLFGEPARWGQTLKSLLWTMTTVQVPGFESQTTLDLPIPCTFDFEVVSSRYLYALKGGDVPLELLFSGPVFFSTDHGLQVEHISWDAEAHYRLPVSVWKDVMQRYFPNTAWVRLHQDTFDRLNRYRSRHALPTWEATLDQLLQATEEPQWTR